MRRNYLKPIFFFSLLLIDTCGLILAFQGAYWTRFNFSFFLNIFPVTKGVPSIALYQQTLWALLPMCLLVFFYLGFYKGILLSAYDEFVRSFKGVILCALMTTAMTFAYRGTEYSRLVIGLWTLYSVVLIDILREFDKLIFRRLQLLTNGPKHAMVVGKGKAVEAIQEMIQHQPFIHTSFVDSVPESDELEQWIKQKQVSELLLVQASLSPTAILAAAQLCDRWSIECKIIPDLLEMRRGEIIVDGFCGLPTFHIKSASLYGTDYLLKRTFDVVVSIFVLTVLFVPLTIVSLLVWLDSPGPILFTQNRMGLRGRHFKVFKFRTMINNADRHLEKLKHLSDRAGPVFKMKNDPRITRIGNWLRASSLDEIPQILNVLRGDMSLVGPRPQVLWEAAHYDETAKKRLRVLPGITGLWQVSGRASLSYEEMINLDIYYLENWSLGLDLKIILRTLPAIFAREGAY
jgi:exopolysaccharide biosynthesis polyprenyl glycosylphosphotransferase